MIWFDIFIQIFFPLILCFSTLPILERFSKFQSLPPTDRFLISVVAGLTGVLFPLYFVGIIVRAFFVETSILLFIVGIVLVGTKFPTFFKALLFYAKKLRNLSANKLRPIDFALIVSIAFFTLKYGFLLYVKEVIDYDVASHYLPFAREIIQQNLIPLTSQGAHVTGAEGGGVLYAWIYGISGSLLSENFRILPLVFILIILLLIFSIAKSFIDENVAKIAVIIFTFMPILDGSLVWFSFYPDVPFTMLVTAALYFLLKYLQTGKKNFCILVGLTLGLSSFMKAQTLWLFPVLLLIVLPSFKNRVFRYSLSLLIPFVFLFGFVPLTYGPDLFGSILVQLSSYFSPSKIWYPFSIVLMSLLIAFINEQAFKTRSFAKLTKIDLAKMIITICICAVPFYLIWYLRNYFFLGTFIWNVSVSGADFQWAFKIVQNISNSGPFGLFYLALLLFPLTLPSLGTTFFTTKLLSVIHLARIDAKASPLYVWGIGYIMFSFAYTYLINERFLLPVVPVIAIFAAIGISLIASYVRKSENSGIMVLITLSLGMFSIVQSPLIYHLIRGGSSFLYEVVSKTSGSIGLPWRILSGQLTISEIGTQTIVLLFFVALVSFALILFVVLGRWCNENKTLNLRIRLVRPEFQSRALHIKIKGTIPKTRKGVIFFAVLIVAFGVLAAPQLYLVLGLSGGNLSSFRYQQRNYYGYGNLYSEVLPYLLGNTSKGDAVMTFGIYGTGLAYYLSNVTLFDILSPENLAVLRSAIESNNMSKTLLTLQNLSVRFILLQSDFFQKTPPIVSSFLDRLLGSKIKLDGRMFSFELIIDGNWNLYELTAMISGVGPSVEVLEDGISHSHTTDYSYFNINNVTAVLKLSGHQTYNITNFPLYCSYETIIPSPLKVSLDANNWINFTGSSDVIYAVYWSNTNWAYRDIIWSDDSFVDAWIPLWGMDQPTTTGDIISLSSPENKTWAHVLKKTSINLQECGSFIARITEINGGVIFAGRVDDDQKYFSPWISSAGIYNFDIHNLGKTNTYVIIYLDKNTTVKIDYTKFAK